MTIPRKEVDRIAAAVLFNQTGHEWEDAGKDCRAFYRSVVRLVVDELPDRPPRWGAITFISTSPVEPVAPGRADRIHLSPDLAEELFG